MWTCGRGASWAHEDVTEGPWRSKLENWDTLRSCALNERTQLRRVSATRHKMLVCTPPGGLNSQPETPRTKNLFLSSSWQHRDICDLFQQRLIDQKVRNRGLKMPFESHCWHVFCCSVKRSVFEMKFRNSLHDVYHDWFILSKTCIVQDFDCKSL